MDSVIRYLESCSEVVILKRKCEFLVNVLMLRFSDKWKVIVSLGLYVGEVELFFRVNGYMGVSMYLILLVLLGKVESVVLFIS